MPFFLRRHMSFYLAACGGVAALAIAQALETPFAPMVGADVFFALYMALTLAAMRRLTAAYLKKHAAAADMPVGIIFLVTFAAVVAALASLFIVINRKPHPGAAELAVTLAAVPLGWFAIHMMAALHYAHVYWQPESPAGRHKGGFEFPGTPEPCGWDFTYYAYVIGMTAQTSDTSVTTSAMRRVTLVHSIVSYFFNAVLIAAAVNAAVALGS